MKAKRTEKPCTKAQTRMPAHRPEVVEVLNALLIDLEGAVPGKMFGCPGAYVDRKLFVFAFEDSLVLRLPADTVEARLAKPGYELFMPSGESAAKSEGRHWLRLRREHPEDYQLDLDLLRQAMAFARSLARQDLAARDKKRNRSRSG
jgi:CRP-like cAMP-binding protein